MNPRIRSVGIVLLLCFGLLFVQLNNIQVRQSKALSRNPLVQVGKVNPIYLPRGAILSSDRKILAFSKRTHGVELRIYPKATAVDFGQITGYVGSSASIAIQVGIEAEYQQYLAQHESPVHTIGQLVTQHQETDDVMLTVSSSMQADAFALVDHHPGAEIVALDPRNGAILAMAGYPSYNPNLLAQIDTKAALKEYAKLTKHYPAPFMNLASYYPHSPGSTFKPIDTAAIFDHHPSLASKKWPFIPYLQITKSSPKFYNYAHSVCGGPLAEILAVSCDTAYAKMGLDLGAHTVVSEAEAFGWCQGAGGVCKHGGSPPPLDLPPSEVAGATMANESLLAANPPYLAYSSIGQYNDTASVLSMALVAAGIANGGRIMAPHLMSQIIDSAGNVVVRYHPHVWKVATSASTAAKVRQLMLGPAESSPYPGTAAGIFTNLQSAGIQVAAKTGTAEDVARSTSSNCATDDWLMAMAPAGSQTPKAVVVAEVPTPNGSSICQTATGAGVAGPLVDQMLTDVLKAGL
ncbi:MAG TPA: penicillin-binding transpeptidase domain-containing protein [Acidimicrobiales bacterium]|nr:penicillin-binding transpeptidase domain-containing protein [Acidimicrobiales bacterium]